MFNLKKNVKPISYIKSHAADMLKQLDELRSPLIITQHGEAKAVMLDIESYQQIIDSVDLLKILQFGESDVSAGRITDHKQVFAELRATISGK